MHYIVGWALAPIQWAWHLLIVLPFLVVVAFITHTIAIPLLTIARILLYGFIYTPIKPVLHALSIDYTLQENHVESTLVQLVVTAWPHASFFLINLLHFIMASIFIGLFVGTVSGYWLRAISSVLATAPSKAKSYGFDFNKPTPHVDKLMDRLPTTNKIKVEEPDFSEAIASGRNLYEDDDGYTFSYSRNTTQASQGSTLVGRLPFVPETTTAVAEEEAKFSPIPESDEW